MKLLDRFRKMVVPANTNFFSLLLRHAELVDSVLSSLRRECSSSSNGQQSDVVIGQLLDEASSQRESALQLLSRTFITPVDKEAISRQFFEFSWVTHAIRHFEVERSTFADAACVPPLTLFDLLCDQAEAITGGVRKLQQGQLQDVSRLVNELTAVGDNFSAAYAEELAKLFRSTGETQSGSDRMKKELMFQLKEINHRMIRCGYGLEDIVFKLG